MAGGGEFDEEIESCDSKAAGAMAVGVGGKLSSLMVVVLFVMEGFCVEEEISRDEAVVAVEDNGLGDAFAWLLIGWG